MNAKALHAVYGVTGIIHPPSAVTPIQIYLYLEYSRSVPYDNMMSYRNGMRMLVDIIWSAGCLVLRFLNRSDRGILWDRIISFLKETQASVVRHVEQVGRYVGIVLVCCS
jgi:hypothetical protein